MAFCFRSVSCSGSRSLGSQNWGPDYWAGVPEETESERQWLAKDQNEDSRWSNRDNTEAKRGEYTLAVKKFSVTCLQCVLSAWTASASCYHIRQYRKGMISYVLCMRRTCRFRESSRRSWRVRWPQQQSSEMPWTNSASEKMSSSNSSLTSRPRWMSSKMPTGTLMLQFWASYCLVYLVFYRELTLFNKCVHQLISKPYANSETYSLTLTRFLKYRKGYLIK